jgi:cytochrome c2
MRGRTTVTSRVLKLLVTIAVLMVGAPAPAADDAIARAAYRWEHSSHGAMLERILPPSLTPQQLPEPSSAGAQLVVAYCVQCHHLVNPAMHDAPRWKSVVARMVWRMEGQGNLGKLMQDLMADVKVPTANEQATLLRYLQKHAQRELSSGQYADLNTESGRRYRIACAQCHVLPDPRRHTASEWPAVVERMRRNMAWANRVTGDPILRTKPELDTADITRYLQRHARARGSDRLPP